MGNEIIYGQDSTEVKADDLQNIKLERGDTRYKKDEQKELYDFVGFVLNERKTLAVFPKHYFSNESLFSLSQANSVLEDDIQLLFDVIYHYIVTEKTTASANKHLGNDPEFEADYPFAAFFSIYNYYKRFGIYQERTTRTEPGYNGKISWKDTIRKSSMIINNGNIIYAPFYVSKNNSKHVFISDCMAYAINYTIERFPYFLSLPQVNYKAFNFDFFENRDYVLSQLMNAKNEVFKDIHLKLIQNLIEFFECFDKSLKGGDIHIKINYFDKLWEKMVQKYLNDHFTKVDETSNQLVFDTSQYYSAVSFSAKTFEVDESKHGFTITPDHYAEFEGNQYIFDSKYYDDINSLNYKQVAYSEILSSNIEEPGKTYSALLLPGEKESTIHYKLAKQYIKNNNEREIIEHYLNVKEVMKHYIGA